MDRQIVPYNGNHNRNHNNNRSRNHRRNGNGNRDGNRDGNRKQRHNDGFGDGIQIPSIPGIKHIWGKLTNSSKNIAVGNYRVGGNRDNGKLSAINKLPLVNTGHKNGFSKSLNFIISCGDQFKSVINNKSYIILSTIAYKDYRYKWSRHLYILVDDKRYRKKIMYQFYKDESYPMKMYEMSKNIKALCVDKMSGGMLSGKETTYRIDIYIGTRKEQTIKFESERERNQWLGYINSY